MSRLLLSVVLKGLNGVSSLLLSWVIAKTYTLDFAGQLFVFLSAATFFSMMGRAGSDQLVVREMVAADSSRAVKLFVLSSVSGVFLLSLVVGISGTAGLFAIGAYSFDEKAIYVILSTLAVVALSVNGFAASVAQGNDRPLLSLFVRTTAWQIVAIVSIVFASIAWGSPAVSNTGEFYMPVGLIIGSGLCCILLSPYFRSLKIEFLKPQFKFIDWSFFGLAIAGTALQFLLPQLLAVLSSKSEVAIYSVAWRLSLLIGLVLVAFNAVLTREIAVMFKNDQLVELRRYLKSTTSLMAIIATPVAVIAMIAPNWCLAFFGASYADSGRVLQVLAIGQLFNVYSGPVGILLVMSGRERQYLKVMCSSLILAIVVFFICMEQGALAGAISSTVYLVAFNAWSLHKCKNIWNQR